MTKTNNGQGSIEYLIFFTLIAAVILSSGVIGRMTGTFRSYFNNASTAMTRTGG